jgi:biotin transport system substrate-specific component
MQQTTTAIAARYYVGEMALGKRLTYMLTFNLLLIVSSYIQIPLPFSPVPITAQTMAVLACGLFLGPIAGALTVLAYLLEGGLGLPVFAGGSAGLARIFGPTGGYLAGFLPAVLLVGFLSEKIRSMTYAKLLAVLTAGTALIFASGLLVVSFFAPEGQALTMGLYPFLPGAAIKIVVTASVLTTYKRIRKSF